jgi:phage tail protein X
MRAFENRVSAVRISGAGASVSSQVDGAKSLLAEMTVGTALREALQFTVPDPALNLSPVPVVGDLGLVVIDVPAQHRLTCFDSKLPGRWSASVESRKKCPTVGKYHTVDSLCAS